MNSEVKNDENTLGDEEIELSEEKAVEDAVVPSATKNTDNVGDASVEINVEQIIADFEQMDDEASARKMKVRRKLEELAEEQSIEDTFAVEFLKD
jgi:hypothetical protein